MQPSPLERRLQETAAGTGTWGLGVLEEEVAEQGVASGQRLCLPLPPLPREKGTVCCLLPLAPRLGEESQGDGAGQEVSDQGVAEPVAHLPTFD